ncbi:hypothetical protein AAE02nite_48430 [Adhaeribacter aerolatus]|uniref:Uncharacterized protein n=1 Tax=Adhaeribacter aerolatus TaxID=670289 RepID=A0A512B5E5_9BACT|nr:hypothetical protein [Adhaeribacter aerolatus]GEO07179.1 hypothetical protein AAE02nite_48430 [Adhaeribacter aerolatus]
MKQQYLILGIIAIVTIVIFIAWTKLKNQKPQPVTDTSRPAESTLPTNKVSNDKLVIVEDADESDIKKILQEFCNSYNKETYQAIPRLTKLSDKKFAITFPFDINFEIYCYFINYVNYPMGFNRHFKTIGWTTTNPSDNWITEKSANKNVMLYVSDFDTEYDNVFLTTFDNIGYKLGFAMGEEKQLLDLPEKNYKKQPIDISEFEAKQHFDFK